MGSKSTESGRKSAGGAIAPSGLPRRRTAWEAVRTRDAAYAGRFVYAVRTTKIYCSPGCAARTPKPENVEYFATGEEAEVEGYRACRRCRPDEPPRAPGFRRVEQARAHLDANLRETVTLEELGAVVGLSPFHLQRTFKKYLGVTPREYVEMRRADRLRELLRDGDEVGRAVYEAGYSSVSRLYEQADAHLGMTPGTYSRGGEGMEIRYATAATPLGRVLVAATERGVCRVSLGDGDERLVADLRREHEAATIVPDDGGLEAWLEAIVGFVEGRTRRLDVPLDVRATTFQWRVWRMLRDIPFGETRTYREVAEAIGEPGAARAVGGACAKNPAALVIPLPPGRPTGRNAGRLSLGGHAQTLPAGARDETRRDGRWRMIDIPPRLLRYLSKLFRGAWTFPADGMIFHPRSADVGRQQVDQQGDEPSVPFDLHHDRPSRSGRMIDAQSMLAGAEPAKDDHSQ